MALSLALCLPAYADFQWFHPHVTGTSVSARELPTGSAKLKETASLHPAWAELPQGGRIQVPGVYTARRTTVDIETGRTVGIELAVAAPRLVHSHSVAGEHPPRIALTFDDGPSGTYTPQLLDLFAEHGARCTFFTLGGRIGSHKQILQRAEQEGHEIAIHSWWHPYYTKMSAGAIKSDIGRCQAALSGVVSQPIRWVRPPFGAVNAKVRSAINDAGYRVAMWSIDPRDWQRPGSSVVASRILNRARDGAVVVLHDGGGNRAGTVAAMRKVVPALIERGYQLVTLSELTGLSEPPPVERGMRLAIGDEMFEVKAEYEDVTVTVDGVELKLDEPPVMVNDQFLVHARPVLDALGSRVRWNAENLAVAFESPRGEFVVKLNSLDVALRGSSVLVEVPSVYYHGTAMLPVWLMANAMNASVRWNQESRTVEFVTSSADPVRSGHGGPGLLTLRGADGEQICWWPESRLLSLIPPGGLSFGNS